MLLSRSHARAALAAQLIAMAAVAACSSAPEPAVVAAPPPSPPPYALTTSATTPVLFAPDAISTRDFESHPAFAPDGRTLYFVKSDPRFTRWTIYESHFDAGHWNAPVIAPFSGTHRDADPFVTADGEHLFFISDRPVNGRVKADMDIWVMDRTPQGWSEPRNLGEPVNSRQSEWHPSVSSTETLYFGSSRPGGLGLTDLYRATSGGGEWHVDNLGAPVNTAGDEYEPMIARDESYVIFMGYRPDSLGASDLYVSWNRHGAWTAPVNLGFPVNSDALELAPYISPNGQYFFFSSTRGSVATETPQPARTGNGLGDIYEIDLSAVLQAAQPSPSRH
jgi:Tol biopolymer transport system component